MHASCRRTCSVPPSIRLACVNFSVPDSFIHKKGTDIDSTYLPILKISFCEKAKGILKKYRIMWCPLCLELIKILEVCLSIVYFTRWVSFTCFSRVYPQKPRILLLKTWDRRTYRRMDTRCVVASHQSNSSVKFGKNFLFHYCSQSINGWNSFFFFL